MVVALVILSFAALILVDYLRHRSAEGADSTEKAASRRDLASQPFGVRDVRISDGVFLGRGHVWARLDRSGTIYLGVDDFAARLAAGVERVEAMASNVRLNRGKPVFTLHLEGGKKMDFYAPFEGRVLAINPQVLRNPSLIRQDAYGSGWLMKIAPVHLSSSLKILRVAEDAKEWMKEEVVRLRDFLAQRAAGASPLPALTDGGLILPDAFDGMDPEGWNAFQKEFLEDF